MAYKSLRESVCSLGERGQLLCQGSVTPPDLPRTLRQLSSDKVTFYRSPLTAKLLTSVKGSGKARKVALAAAAFQADTPPLCHLL